MQYLDVLDQARIDKVTRCIRKITDAEMIGQRHAIDDNGDAIASDTTDVDAFRTETIASRLGIDTGHIPEHVVDRGGEIIV